MIERQAGGLKLTGEQVAKILLGLVAWLTLSGAMLVLVMLLGCGPISQELVQCIAQCQGSGVCEKTASGGYACVVPAPSPSPTATPTPVPSVTPTPEPSSTPSPADPCAAVLCPPGTECHVVQPTVEEAFPPRAVCVPLPSPSPVITPTPAPSAAPSASPTPVVTPPACEGIPADPEPSVNRNGVVVASKKTVCGKPECDNLPPPLYFCASPQKKFDLLMGTDGNRREAPELFTRMLPDGSAGYVVGQGPKAYESFDFWGRLYTCWPPSRSCQIHSPEDGANNVCPPPPCVTPPPPTPPPPSAPPPSPPPSTDPNERCAANGLKLGLRAVVDKRNDCRDCKGFRNSFEVTPTRDGKPIGPETGCGMPLILQYGEIVGQITESGGRTSGFEHQGCSLEDWKASDGHGCNEGDFYLFVDATNSDGDPDHWSGKTYLAGGPRTYCVTWPKPYMNTWRCQSGAIDDRGAAVGFGRNEQARDVPK